MSTNENFKYFRIRRKTFFLCLLLTILKLNFCQNYITLNMSSFKEKAKVANNDRTNVHHITDVLLKATQILQRQAT